MANEPTIKIKDPDIYVEATDYADPYDLKSLAGITAQDSHGVDITDNVVINTSAANYLEPGDYDVSVSTQDDDFNMAIKQIKVHVLSPQEVAKIDDEEAADKAYEQPTKQAKKKHSLKREHHRKRKPRQEKQRPHDSRQSKFKHPGRKRRKKPNKRQDEEMPPEIHHSMLNTILEVLLVLIVIAVLIVTWFFFTN